MSYLDTLKGDLENTSQDLKIAREQGDVEFLKDLKQYVAVITIGLDKINLDASKFTKQYTASLQKEINLISTSIPEANNSEIIKANFQSSQLTQALPEVEKISPSEAIAYLSDWADYLDGQLEVLNSLGDDEKGKAEALQALSDQQETVDKIIAFRKNQLLLLNAASDVEKIVPNAKDFVNSSTQIESIQNGSNAGFERLNNVDRQINNLRSQQTEDGEEEKLINRQISELEDIKRIFAIQERINDAIAYLSQLPAAEAAPKFKDLEKQVRENFNKGIKFEFTNSFTKEVKEVVQAQLKTVKTARKLALLDIDFDFNELISDPKQYFETIKDAGLAKAKEAAKKKSLSTANQLVVAAKSAIEEFVDDFKDRILEAVEIVKKKALPGTSPDTPLLRGKGEIVKAGDSDIIKSDLSEAGQAILIRAIADSVLTGKNTYGTLQRIEQGIFDVFPLLRAGKALTQTAAPVVGGIALASQSPEIAALAKLSAQELAIVIQPLLHAGGGALGDLASNIPGIGGGARAAIQFLANNGALTSSASSGAGALTAYGAIGGGAGAIAKAGTKLAARKTFDALPESLKNQLTPEAITAFDNLVATRQQEIKQLAGTLNKKIAAIKASNSKEGTQKLLTGYQQLDDEIKELEAAVSSNDKTALKRTRDRISELKGIQKGLRKALNQVGDESKKILTNTVESIFDVDVTPVDTKDVSKKTLKKAITDYKQEIIAHRKKLEKKILDGTAVDSDFQASAELAKRGQALSESLKQRRGFSREARGLTGVSDTLAGKIPQDKNAITAGDDVINGILKGTNEKLAQVFIQGRTLGIELLDGFKQELEIKSPSGKFISGMSEVAAGIIEGRKRKRDLIRAAGIDIGTDLYEGSKIGLGEYQDLLANLETLIQQKETLQSLTYQQAFDAPESDISSQLEDINYLESQIQSAADAIAAFQENAELPEVDPIEVEVEVGEVEEPELPEVDPIEVEVEVGEAELDDFLNDIPEEIDLDVEADTGRSTERLNRLDRNLEQVRNTARTALKAIIGFGLVRISGAITNQLEDIVRTSIETQIRFEQLETSIEFIAGSADKGAKSLKFIGDTARKLKLDLAVATDGYKKLAAASRNTELESETNRIFGSITQASRVFGLSGEQTEGALLAVSQMISKGNVQAEELRGQLGERIPGAFQIAARSMNVTTSELGKLLETGQVVAVDFLPNFARQLESETRGGVIGAIKTTGAALQGLRSSYTQFQLDLAKTTKPAQIALYTALAEGLELAGDNLNILIPASKILTATLITLFLPAIVSLGSLLKGAIAKGFTQLLTLLHANNTSMNNFAKATRIASAAFKAFIVVEAISQAIALTHNLVTINQEAKDAVKNLDAAYQNFLENLSKNNPDNPLLKEDIITGNQEKVRNELGKTANFLDWVREKLEPNPSNPSLFPDLTPEFIKNIPGLGADNIAESVVKDADDLVSQAIDKANKNLDNIFFKVDVIADAEDEDLTNAIDSLNQNIGNLEISDPQSLETLESRTVALDDQKRLLQQYNDELLRRGGLGKSLAKVEVVRRKTVDDATEAEREGLNALNQEILESGDFKRNLESAKLEYTKTRIRAELEAEKKAIAENEKLVIQRNFDKIVKGTEKLQSQLNSGAISAFDFALGVEEIEKKFKGIDPDSGFLKGLSKKEVEHATKRRDRLAQLQSSSIENSIALAQSEVDSKLQIYDRFLESITEKIEAANNLAITSEKERLIEIQQLVNDEVITVEEAEELKLKANSQQLKASLDQEKKKLRKLKNFKSDEVEAQEKADNEIKQSKTKILDLTLSLLEQEETATEKTINAIAQSRDNVFSALEQRLNRLRQIQQSSAGLISDRNAAFEKLDDLQLAKLRQALELRKQLNSGDLNRNERRTILKQLHGLGVEGKTSELGLLNQIQDKEKEIAEVKIANLLRQQALKQQEFELEAQQLELTTKKGNLEAKRGQRDARQELISAEAAIATAETKEEFDRANDLYDLALSSLRLADDEAAAAQKELNNLDNIISKKQEILDINQEIALAELSGNNQDKEFDLDKEVNAAREARDRRRAESGRNVDLSRYLSRQEGIDQQVEQRRERQGENFTEEDEAKLRTKLSREFNRSQSRQERGIKNNLRGNSGFTIEAPPEILKLIHSGQSISVPAIQPFKSTAPLQAATVGKTKGSLGDGEQVLKVLRNIETKFKQPTVYNVQNDNNFTNVYDKSDTDEVVREVRSEIVDTLNTFEAELNNGF